MFSRSCNGTTGLLARYGCVPSVERMTWGVSPGPAGAVGDADERPGHRPAWRNAGRSRAAGLHNVDARARCHRRGRHGQHPWAGRRQDRSPRPRADPAGKKVFDKPMPNSEPKLRAVFDKLKAKFGTVMVIVDQPASIGALPLTRWS